MLFRWASLPPVLLDPSLIIRTGTPPVCPDKPPLLRISLSLIHSVKVFLVLVLSLIMHLAGAFPKIRRFFALAMPYWT
jgi:hypothetical protein